MIDDTISTVIDGNLTAEIDIQIAASNEWKNKTFDRLRKQWWSYAPTKVHSMPTRISLEFMNAAWIEACACLRSCYSHNFTDSVWLLKHFDALNAGNNTIDGGILNARKSRLLCVRSMNAKSFHPFGFLATEKLSDNFLSHAERVTTKKIMIRIIVHLNNVRSNST